MPGQAPEQIFDRMRPWIQAITTQGKYQRLKCTSCGAWTREKKAIYTSNTGA